MRGAGLRRFAVHPSQEGDRERKIVRVHRLGEGPRAVDARIVAEDALHGGRFVDDHAIGVEDRDDVRGILDQGAEARLASAEVDGHGLQTLVELAEAAVLDAEAPRGAGEREPQETEQTASRRERDQKDVPPGRLHPLLDRPSVEVDLEHADRVGVGEAADRRVHLEVTSGMSVAGPSSEARSPNSLVV